MFDVYCTGFVIIILSCKFKFKFKLYLKENFENFKIE